LSTPIINHVIAVGMTNNVKFYEWSCKILPEGDSIAEEMSTQAVHFTLSITKMTTINNHVLAPFKLSSEKFKS